MHFVPYLLLFLLKPKKTNLTFISSPSPISFLGLYSLYLILTYPTQTQSPLTVDPLKSQPIQANYPMLLLTSHNC